MSFPTLSSPSKIGSLTLKNRFIMTAMGSNYAESDGTCAERIAAYYEERARGGTALIVMETSSIAWPEACSMPNMVGLSDDRFIPGLSALVARVQRYDCAIAAQINHSGKVSQEDVVEGRPILVPSLPPKTGSGMFRLLTDGEIQHFIKSGGPDGKGPRYKVMNQRDITRITEQFADAAERCQRAGFDAVEIHGGHGYLLASFLSPAINKRDDEYGGSVENRARFLVEVIRAVKEKCGRDYPVMVRLDAHEYRVDNGIEIDDFLTTAKLAEGAGADLIDVSAYGNIGVGIAFTEAPLPHQPDAYKDFAQRAKQALSIPVMAVGRIELESAERAISRGQYDFLGLGRKILADPAVAQKVTSNQANTIRPCIYCYICVSQIFINQPMLCAVNADMGQEHLPLIATDRQSALGKRIIVVGGGPGGMEAARRLAEAGCSVSLYEQAPDLGGTARIAALAYEPNGRLIDWQARELKRLGVTIHTGTRITIDAIKALKPDHVVVATGARREAPDIAGKDARNVFDGEEMRGLLLGGSTSGASKLNVLNRLVVTIGRWMGATRSIKLVREFSRLWMPVGQRVTIIGGGLVGIELAEFLVERGREVTVVDPEKKLAPELSIVRRARVLHELEEHGCEMIRNAQAIRCEPNGVRYQSNEQETFVSADTIIIALGAEANPSFADDLTAHGVKSSVIGDAAAVGYIDGAIHSARALCQQLLSQWQ